jgi:hypothetical protein
LVIAGLLLPLVKVMPPASRWRIRSRISRWYRELRRIDMELEQSSGDPEEISQLEARIEEIESDAARVEVPLKYMDLVTNAVMLHNVADLTDVLAGMADEGLPVTRELASRLSPYTRDHLRRFGQYTLDMDDLPPVLHPRPLPIPVDGP